MNILVTGGSGRIGSYVVRELMQAGHNLTSVDVRPPADKRCRFLRMDLTNSGEVYQTLATAHAEAAIHLGAWASAGIVPDTRTYGDNVQGTFNLFQACADMGIKRVISASSAQVYGFAKAPPQYVPVDETHPLRPANCYALSKIAGEQVADYFVERFGMTILSFRFMGIRTPNEISLEIARIVENPGSGTGLLWTRTDVRDAAMACRLAVEVEKIDSGPYNITGSRIILSESTATLVERYFGSRTTIREILLDGASPLNCTKGKVAFGYRPRFPWSVSQQFLESE